MTKPVSRSSSTVLNQTLQQLYQRSAHGVKLGLETINALLARMGHPQNAFPCVHVAGTNGKGSVCAILDAILREAGCRTGLYTSPHLVRFNERLRVNGVMIEDDALVELIKRVEAAETEMLNAGESRAATFFEFTTALAFEHFKRSGVDLAVLETGLGGRLDATNVVTPLVSIITSIGVDHAGYLGHDLRQVAAEKGGIIKPGRPVLCGAREPEAREVIFAIARERGSNLVVVDEVASVRRLGQSLTAQRVKLETSSMSYPPVSLPLVGEHQLENGAIAVAAAEYLSQAGVLDIGQEAICRGLERVVWPGRFQLLSEDPVLVLDAAHNPSGAHVLLRTLKEVAGDVPLGLLASFSSEKDSYGFFSVFAGSVERTWLVPLENERGMPMEKMEADAVAAGLRPVTSSRRDALAEATAWAREVKGVVCIAGSIYLVGEVLEGRECGPV